MRFQHLQYDYDLPDEWWQEAGMQTFVPMHRTYVSSIPSTFDEKLIEVAIENLEPLLRKGSHGVFNDNSEFGTAHDRVLRILRGFIEGAILPPVKVTRLNSSYPLRYRLIDGAHRTYCAIAAGYSHVPAVEVDDFFDTYPGS